MSVGRLHGGGDLRTERVPVAGPWVTSREIQYVADAAEHDWYQNAGRSVPRFEAALAEYIGVRYAAAVPHCTSALHLALLAHGVRPGDEVIVPESTWVATAAPIFYVGARPVFADIEPTTWCMSPESVQECVTDRTRVILPVDLYGGVPDMDALDALAERHGLAIVEDAAQSLGATWHGRHAGSFGSVATFSFHGTKIATTGEGGMVVTDDPDIAQRISALRDHGRTAGNHRFFTTDEIAFKYRMSSLQAAFGLAQIERIEELVARQRQIFAWYSDRLEGIDGLTLNVESPGSRNTYWMVTVILDADLGWQTHDLMSALDSRQIDSRPFFPPLSSLNAMRDVPDVLRAQQRNSVAYDLSHRGINLPSAAILTEADVDYVCENLLMILKDR
jgi:perosamine synthetase